MSGRSQHSRSDRAARFTNGDVGRCPATGKLRWTSRKAAKECIRRTPGGPKSVYQCPMCNYWHAGSKGSLTREQHRKLRDWNHGLTPARTAVPA